MEPKPIWPRQIIVDREDETGRAPLCDEILQYLRAHPRAADTLEGIVGWWLPRQRYELAQQRIQQALNNLVVRGLVEKITLANGTVVYSSPKRNTDNGQLPSPEL